MYPSFTVAGFTLYNYSIMIVLGAGTCIGIFVGLTFYRHRGKGAENGFAIGMLAIAMAAAWPAAMVFDSLFKIAENGGKFILKGATFYGGLLCALAIWPLLLLTWRKRTVTIYERLADIAPGIPAGHFFGRIGCFLGGCCFGAPTDGPFGVVFPEGSMPYEFYGGPTAVHPTQLYEAAALLLIFVILFFWGKKNAFPLYLILYGLARFGIEFLRADDRGFIPGIPLSPAQFISIVLIFLGEGILLYRVIKANRRPPKTA